MAHVTSDTTQANSTGTAMQLDIGVLDRPTTTTSGTSQTTTQPVLCGVVGSSHGNSDACTITQPVTGCSGITIAKKLAMDDVNSDEAVLKQSDINDDSGVAARKLSEGCVASDGIGISQPALCATSEVSIAKQPECCVASDVPSITQPAGTTTKQIDICKASDGIEITESVKAINNDLDTERQSESSAVGNGVKTEDSIVDVINDEAMEGQLAKNVQDTTATTEAATCTNKTTTAASVPTTQLADSTEGKTAPQSDSINLTTSPTITQPGNCVVEDAPIKIASCNSNQEISTTTQAESSAETNTTTTPESAISDELVTTREIQSTYTNDISVQSECTAPGKSSTSQPDHIESTTESTQSADEIMSIPRQPDNSDGTSTQSAGNVEASTTQSDTTSITGICVENAIQANSSVETKTMQKETFNHETSITAIEPVTSSETTVTQQNSSVETTVTQQPDTVNQSSITTKQTANIVETSITAQSTDENLQNKAQVTPEVDHENAPAVCAHSVSVSEHGRSQVPAVASKTGEPVSVCVDGPVPAIATPSGGDGVGMVTSGADARTDELLKLPCPDDISHDHDHDDNNIPGDVIQNDVSDVNKNEKLNVDVTWCADNVLDGRSEAGSISDMVSSYTSFSASEGSVSLDSPLIDCASCTEQLSPTLQTFNDSVSSAAVVNPDVNMGSEIVELIGEGSLQSPGGESGYFDDGEFKQDISENLLSDTKLCLSTEQDAHPDTSGQTVGQTTTVEHSENRITPAEVDVLVQLPLGTVTKEINESPEDVLQNQTAKPVSKSSDRAIDHYSVALDDALRNCLITNIGSKDTCESNSYTKPKPPNKDGDITVSQIEVPITAGLPLLKGKETVDEAGAQSNQLDEKVKGRLDKLEHNPALSCSGAESPTDTIEMSSNDKDIVPDITISGTDSDSISVQTQISDSLEFVKSVPGIVEDIGHVGLDKATIALGNVSVKQIAVEEDQSVVGMSGTESDTTLTNVQAASKRTENRVGECGATSSPEPTTLSNSHVHIDNALNANKSQDSENKLTVTSDMSNPSSISGSISSLTSIPEAGMPGDEPDGSRLVEKMQPPVSRVVMRKKPSVRLPTHPVVKDTQLQEQIDHEIKMRDGTAKLLAASKHPSQLLEAAKNLLTSNARMIAYMSELQRRKTDEVLNRHRSRNASSSSVGSADSVFAALTKDDSVKPACKAKVSLSDIRIPLMWRDSDHFKNKGDHRRFAVFCVLKIGTQIYDTCLVQNVDSRMTDVSFDDAVVFDNISPDFECRLEVYCHRLCDDHSITSTPRRLKKKLNEISTSVGRSVGRRLSGLKEDPEFMANMIVGPRFELIASATLKLADVNDSISIFDLPNSSSASTEGGTIDLPLFGNFCCRLAAQPRCMVQEVASGNLQMKVGSETWRKQWCRLGKQSLCTWSCERDQKEAQESIHDITITTDSRVKAVDKDHLGDHTFQLAAWSNGRRRTYLMSLETQEDRDIWVTSLQQHIINIGAWKQACDKVMDIEQSTPPNRRATFTQRPRSSLYYETPWNDDDSPMTRVLNRLDLEERDSLKPL